MITSEAVSAAHKQSHACATRSTQHLGMYRWCVEGISDRNIRTHWLKFISLSTSVLNGGHSRIGVHQMGHMMQPGSKKSGINLNFLEEKLGLFKWEKQPFPSFYSQSAFCRRSSWVLHQPEMLQKMKPWSFFFFSNLNFSSTLVLKWTKLDIIVLNRSTQIDSKYS